MLISLLGAAFLALLVLAVSGVPLKIPLFFLFIVLVAISIAAFPETLASIAVIFLAVSLIAFRVGAILVRDLHLVLRALRFPQLFFLMIWSIALTAPLICLSWLVVDAADLRENWIFYGCDGNSGVYGTQSRSETFYGRVQGTDRFVFARVNGESNGDPSSIGWLNDPVAQFCELPDPGALHEQSAIRTITNYTGILERNLLERVDTALNAAGSRGLQGNDAVQFALFGDNTNSCPPSDGAGVLPASFNCFHDLPRSCGLWRWITRTGECIERKVMRPVHSAYARARNSSLESYHATASRLVGHGQDAGSTTRQLARFFVQTQINRIESGAILAVQRFFFGYRLLEGLALLLVAMAVSKAFFYIFGRLVFSSKAGNVNLDLSDLNKVESRNHRGERSNQNRERIRERASIVSSSELTIDIPLEGMEWYAARKSHVSWDVRQPIRWLFRPSQIPFRRILCRKSSFHVYKPHDEVSHLRGAHDVDTKVVKILMEPDLDLVIDIGSLVAFSEGIEFRTIFNPRLSAFLQHRLFFTVVSGAGYLLLSGNGGTIWGSQKSDERDAVPPEDIIAMDLSGLYRCHALTDPISVYVEPFTIASKPGTLLISHKPRRTIQRTLLRTMRRLVFFILPI